MFLDGAAFAFYIENDSRIIGGPGSDQSFSSGLKLSYMYAENRIPAWSRKPVQFFKAWSPGLEQAKVNYGISLGHQIYTPAKISETQLITTDRPYAGSLYLGLLMSFKEEQAAHFLELDIGMIGPSALGKEIQNSLHDMIARPKAMGWENGLHDEPTLQLAYQKRLKYFQTENMDFIPSYGVGLGNVHIGGHIGGLFRYGIHLPDDYGPSRPSSGNGDSFVSPSTNPFSLKKRMYGFAGIRGNVVGRNIFLDGNTFQSSHRVRKNTLTFESEFGLGVQLRAIEVVWRFVTRSPEVDRQSSFSSFASLHLIYFH